jgi:hypothetical protein
VVPHESFPTFVLLLMCDHSSGCCVNPSLDIRFSFSPSLFIYVCVCVCFKEDLINKCITLSLGGKENTFLDPKNRVDAGTSPDKWSNLYF